MYKVFLVEDESIVREGLRDNIPWEQYGFRFVGDAPDGEVALPAIRRERPDVLITDIRMPFMDGLSLCRIVREEFPEIRIMILSGYDDFEYARKAIEIGVDRYLTKPITRKAMTRALAELSHKIEQEKQKEDALYQYRAEMHEYEQYRVRHFFEEVFAGKLTVEQMIREADRLRINTAGPRYALLLADIYSERESGVRLVSFEEEEELTRCKEEFFRYVLRFPEYIAVRWVNDAFLVVAKGSEEVTADYVRRAVDKMEEIVQSYAPAVKCFVCISDQTGRFSQLRESYEQVRRFFSCRYLDTGFHVITAENFEQALGSRAEGTDSGQPAERPNAETKGSQVETEERLSENLPGDILSYIETHCFDEDISLNSVAQKAGLSAGYFSAMFSQKMKMTFIEYVTARRIEKAKQLLRNTKKHTTQIAGEVGYKDPNYFRYVFKKETGVSPRVYRTLS